VAQDCVRAEHAEIAQPGDRRLAVTREHLVELDDGLRGVELPGAAALVGARLEACSRSGVHVST
jgi:hypothetical protein